MARPITDEERKSVERLRKMFAEPQTPEERAFADRPTEENLNMLTGTTRDKGTPR